MRPVELGHTFKVGSRLSTQRWNRPDADVAAARAVLLANPKRDQRAIGGEPQGADRGIDKLRRAPPGQVVELSRADLRNPDVHLSVPVRQKGHEMAVAGHRSGLLQSIEVRDRLKSCVRYGISPEVLRPLEPEACANRQSASRRCQRQQESPSAKKGSCHRPRRLRRRVGRYGIGPILLPYSEIPAAHPGIQVRTRRVDRTHPVMQVSVDRHPLPLLPALDRCHVAFEVSRDLLPRIQAVFQWFLGWRYTEGWFAHRTLLLGPHVTNSETQIVASSVRKGTAKHCIRRQIEERLQFCALPLEGTHHGARLSVRLK